MNFKILIIIIAILFFLTLIVSCSFSKKNMIKNNTYTSNLSSSNFFYLRDSLLKYGIKVKKSSEGKIRKFVLENKNFFTNKNGKKEYIYLLENIFIDYFKRSNAIKIESLQCANYLVYIKKDKLLFKLTSKSSSSSLKEIEKNFERIIEKFKKEINFPEKIYDYFYKNYLVKSDIEQLLSQKKNLNQKSNDSPLFHNLVAEKIWVGHKNKEKFLDLLDLFLQKGLDLNLKDNDGNTLLHLAIKYNFLDLVKFLIKKKIDLKVQNNDRETAFFFLFTNLIKKEKSGFDFKIAKLLLDSGVKVDVLDDKKETIFYHLVKKFLNDYSQKNLTDENYEKSRIYLKCFNFLISNSATLGPKKNKDLDDKFYIFLSYHLKQKGHNFFNINDNIKKIIGEIIEFIDPTEKILARFNEKVLFKNTEKKEGELQAMFRLARTYNALGLYDKAIKKYQIVIEKSPIKTAESYNNLTNTLIRSKKYDQALKVINQALKINPNYASVYYNLACIYSLKGERSIALINLKKAIDLNSKYIELAQKDKDFTFLKQDKEFQAIIYPNQESKNSQENKVTETFFRDLYLPQNPAEISKACLYDLDRDALKVDNIKNIIIHKEKKVDFDYDLFQVPYPNVIGGSGRQHKKLKIEDMVDLEAIGKILKANKLELSEIPFTQTMSFEKIYKILEKNGVDINELKEIEKKVYQIIYETNLISFKDNKIIYNDPNLDPLIPLDAKARLFTPLIKNRYIGFIGKHSFFYLIDFKNKTSKHYRILHDPFDERIKKISIANEDKLHFIFYIRKSLGSHSSFHYHMKLIDCSGEKAISLKELQTYDDVNENGYIRYEVIKNKILLFKGRTRWQCYDIKNISVLDMAFNPSSYKPLETFFNHFKKKLFIWFYNQHPNLPFAIVRDKFSNKILLLEDSRSLPLIKFHNKHGILPKQFFSPDGKWLIHGIKYSSTKLKFFLFPISNRYPAYIGSPIDLDLYDSIGHRFHENDYAWSIDSTAFAYMKYSDKIALISFNNKENQALLQGEYLHKFIVDYDLKKNKIHFNKQRNFLSLIAR